MQQSPIKQLIQLIGQAGGTVALSISELRELGVEITLENICDDKNGRVVLRLGPKIYYVPTQIDVDEHTLPEEVHGLWPQEIATPKPLRTSSSAPPSHLPMPTQVDLEMEAVGRITNRPRLRKTQAQLVKEVAQRIQKQRPQRAEELEHPLPYAKVGVHRLNDMELWLQEQVRGETLKTQEKAHRAQELRSGDMPFRTIPGR